MRVGRSKTSKRIPPIPQTGPELILTDEMSKNRVEPEKEKKPRKSTPRQPIMVWTKRGSIVCQKCGMKCDSGMNDRWQDFLIPHWKSCRRREDEMICDLFTWK